MACSACAVRHAAEDGRLRGLLSPTPKYPRIPNSNFVDPIPSFEIEDTGSVTITYAPVDVRPRTPTVLPAVDVLVNEREGTVLRVEWTATAENVDGKVAGELGIEVVPQPEYYETLPGETGATRSQ